MMKRILCDELEEVALKKGFLSQFEVFFLCGHIVIVVIMILLLVENGNG